MLVEVPEPVWKTSSGKCSKRPPPPVSPAATSSAASCIACAISASMTPSSALTAAAAALIRASAVITSRGMRSPDTAWACARSVCAPHKASAGTRTSPIESCSVRNVSADAAESLMHRSCPRPSSRTEVPPMSGGDCPAPRRQHRCHSDVHPATPADNIDVAPLFAGDQRCHIDVGNHGTRGTSMWHRCSPAWPSNAGGTSMPSMRVGRSRDRSGTGGDGQQGGPGGGDVGEEVVALVVDDDEGGEVADLDPPDRLHPQLGVLEHLDLRDALLRQPRGRAADRAQVETAVLAAGCQIGRAHD